MSTIHKISLLFLFVFILSVNMNAQTETADKITLKTGEVFVGKIQLRNAELILIESQDGARYQFPNTEIKSIEKIDLNNYKPKKDGLDVDSHLENKVVFGLLELSGGVYSARNKLNIVPGGQFSLTFGAKLFEQKSIFTGVGIGLSSLLDTKNQESINFLPLFLAFRTNLNNNTNSPYLQLRAGYSLALTDEMEGGLYAGISVGWGRKLNENTKLFLGFYTALQSFSGNLIETNQTGDFSYYGHSALLSFGLNVGIEF